MAYVNEYVSEHEIIEHKLDSLLAEFHRFEWRDGRPAGFIHTWTINRDVGAHLVRVKMVQEVGPSGRPEPTAQDIFVLTVNGGRVQATLDHSGGSRSFTDNPFVVNRNLVSMSVEATISEETAREMLKEALAVYGYEGVLIPVANTVVVFNF